MQDVSETTRSQGNHAGSGRDDGHRMMRGTTNQAYATVTATRALEAVG